jgi:hypothetical protein
LVEWSVRSEKVKKFSEPKIDFRLFFVKTVTLPVEEKQKTNLVKKAKEEYLLLAGRDQISP